MYFNLPTYFFLCEHYLRESKNQIGMASTRYAPRFQLTLRIIHLLIYDRRAQGLGVSALLMWKHVIVCAHD